MQIYLNGSRPTRLGPAEYFTGSVQLDPVIGADPAGMGANTVRFAPGARTNWHHHAHGQVLHVTAGSGFICTRGGTPQPIVAGDSVWIPPGEEHWHGAGPATSLTHIAIQRSADGAETTWLEPVSDADYPA